VTRTHHSLYFLAKRSALLFPLLYEPGIGTMQMFQKVVRPFVHLLLMQHPSGATKVHHYRLYCCTTRLGDVANVAKRRQARLRHRSSYGLASSQIDAGCSMCTVFPRGRRDTARGPQGIIARLSRFGPAVPRDTDIKRPFCSLRADTSKMQATGLKNRAFNLHYRTLLSTVSNRRKDQEVLGKDAR
jgi:hypothetical protein